MTLMKRSCLFCALLSLLAGAVFPVSASEAEMKKVLSAWEQQMSEYRAALGVAESDEQRAAVHQPDGKELAAPLWKAICGKTGERDELVQPTIAERMKGAKPTTKKKATYEFEESWAAPAVFWFMERPDFFAALFRDKPRQLSFFADALMDSIQRRHYTNPQIASTCAVMAASPSVRNYEILEKVYTRNQNPEARSCAALAMSLMLGDSSVSTAEGSEAVARSKRVYYLKQALNLAPEGALFGTVPLTRVAADLAYVLRRLSVGSIPPQARLLDRDGKQVFFPAPGKAHLLFFWSPDEELGSRLVSKKDALLRQYPDLVFCPITTHQEREAWLSMLSERGVELCYMDNEQDSTGKDYRITQLPTAVLVDSRCRILYMGYPDMKLQTALDSFFHSHGAGSDKPKVTIGGQEGESPVIQPGSQPEPAKRTPSASDEPPALREMPNF